MQKINLSGSREMQICILVLFGFREEDAIKTVDKLAGMIPVVGREDEKMR